MKLPSHDSTAHEVPEDRSHRLILPRRAPKAPLRQVVRRLMMALLVLLATVFTIVRAAVSDEPDLPAKQLARPTLPGTTVSPMRRLDGE